MKTNYHIKNNKPVAPYWFTIVIYLLIEKFNFAGVAWGIGGTLVFLAWIYYITKAAKSVEIDIFHDLKFPINPEVKKTFNDLVNDAIRRNKERKADKDGNS